ncbi:MAG: twin-arginine translocase TatA/TatE family subunit [Chloroflexi bacterium]|nr:twin-arginine translocase TatA/TatE family subunit [Chloroflexota bacterium]
MGFGPIGLPQILIILVIVLLIFGAKRLPEIGSSLGKGIRSFKSSVTGEDDVTQTSAKSESPNSTDETKSP